ncbi:protein-tyrosine phosphatase-like protein [Chaetomium strumarium]|uniref:Protein-tyrosine phosphatase-like protein n=1 Tax=Chaetomium strumarium TaxID=1170767 RepID=A0AAJ0M746_9PEZI|nr:protein-tyrosine phosphatase-like protein [Chaetomium strumarium]
MAAPESGWADGHTTTGTGTNNSTTLPSPPFIHAPGLANLRDAGGYAIASQPRKAVKRGVLFRSADLTELGGEGIGTLQRLGITHVFDLRSVVELAKSGEQSPRELWQSASHVFVPVFLDKDYSPEALALRFRNYSDGPQGFVKAYAAILATAAEPDHPYAPFRTILEHLASATPPSPVLVHCTAGKDRTGVIIALILALCGLEDEAIATEYSLTDAGLAPRKERIVQQLTAPGAALFGERERAERMVGAQKENMLLTLKLIREKYGSVETYVVDHLGVSQASVEQIRKNLIVDLAEGEEPLDWGNLAGLKNEPRL